MFSGADAEPAAETKEEKPAKKTEKKQKAKEVTLAEVRAVLAEKSRQGHTREVSLECKAPKFNLISGEQKKDVVTAD